MNDETLVASFKTWLAGQDDSERIDYCNNHDCLLARFLKHCYPNTEVEVGACDYTVGDIYGVIPSEIRIGFSFLSGINGLFYIFDAKKQFLS